VRPPILPLVGTPAQRIAGASIFAANCASCHGGAKWSKSQVIYADNPAFDGDPNAAVPGEPRDPGVTNAGAQIVSYTVPPPPVVGGDTLRFLDPVGTFDINNPLEIRNNGITALGGLGFNAPALLGLRYHGPFFHDGSARNLTQVFARHQLGTGTIASTLNATQELNLRQFLLSLDGSVPPFDSDTDEFLDGIID
jgi:cytochrome c peroxidase